MSVDWTEIKISVDNADAESAEAIAHMTVPYGIYVEDYSNLEQEVREIANIDLIDEELLGRDRSKTIIHIYISPEENPREAVAYLGEMLSAQGILNSIDCSSCKEEDWLNNWKSTSTRLRSEKSCSSARAGMKAMTRRGAQS